MHIVQVVAARIPGADGIGTHALQLGARLEKRGHRVTVMTRSSSWRLEKFEYEGLQIVGVPFLPLYPFHVAVHSVPMKWALSKLEPKPDVVHFHTPLVPAVSGDWPVLTTVHTPMWVDTAWTEGSGPSIWAMKIMGKTTSFWAEKILMKKSTALLAVSESIAEEVRLHYKPKQDIQALWNDVDNDFFSPEPSMVEPRRVLYIGRLAYRKGLFELVESAKQVVQADPNVSYKIVGKGPLEEPLKKRVAELGIGNNVEFCGEAVGRDAVKEHYQKAEITLVPSYYEGCPYTLLEAMSTSNAIVSTTADFTRGILEDGFNSLLVPPKSTVELADATLRLLNDKALCLSLGKAARETVMTKMNPVTNTDKIEAIYSNLVKEFSN